jgi:polar amino acid transport system substrate-binding protein
MHLIMADAGLEYDMELMPWARAIALAENRNGYCVFTTVHNKERDTRFQWVEPLLTSYSYLVKSADSKVRAATLGEARQQLVGTQLGDYTVDILESLQFTRIDLASDIEVTINKLLLGRIDLMPMAGSLISELQQKGIPVKPLLVLNKSLNGVACNKEIPAETIAKMQASLDKLTEDGTWDGIFKKHGVNRNAF